MAEVKPLAGKRVLVTRPREQAGDLTRLLEEQGAQCVLFPAIAILPVDDTSAIDRAISHPDSYDWVIFTSANAVTAVWERIGALGLSNEIFANTKAAAIGPATARALESHGVRPAWIPPKYVAEAVAEGLGEVGQQKILLLRADIAREALPQILASRGAQVDDIAAYRTVLAQPDDATLAELERGIDIVTFTSASTVRSFLQMVEGKPFPWLPRVTYACIGPITAEELRQNGFMPHIVAEEYTSQGLVQAMEAYFEPAEKRNL
jgi:uroporphyrinogen-III synthase